MWPRFGVKVGNSTLCIAQIKPDTKPHVIANKQGDRVSQACLLWDGVEEIECGLTAKQKMSSKPKQAVANSFQFLRAPEDITEELLIKFVKTITCEYDSEKHQFQLKAVQPTNDVESREVTKAISAFDVQVKLLETELELARQYHSDSAQKPIVVLSIPGYYPSKSWAILAQAAEKAGFHVAQVVEESTAAVLAYGIGEGISSNHSKYILTVKCGGIFSHFALYEIKHGLYTKMECFGPFPIGGHQFTEELVKFICEEFKRKYKLDPHESRRSLAKIRTAAANCKHILSTLPSTQLYIDSLMDGVDFNTQMSRARFESLIQPVINTFMQILNECVEKGLQRHPEMKKLDNIVLLGATTQIPKLQAVICNKYPDVEINSLISADEVVAVGCARQCLYLEDSEKTILESSEVCDFIVEEVTIWHGSAENDENSQKLLSAGDILPKTVTLNIKLNDSCLDSDIFQLRFGSKINEVHIKKSANSIPEEGFVRLEAEIQKCENKSPLVRLRCA